MTTPSPRYSAVAITLHWLIAALILANIGLAWTFKNTPQGLTWFKLIQLHKSVGITVLVLSLARLAWRLFNPPPPRKWWTGRTDLRNAGRAGAAAQAASGSGIAVAADGRTAWCRGPGRSVESS